MNAKKYNLIYADPPWQYNDKGCDGAAEKQYPTMPLKDICALPIKEQIEKDAILFLWATAPLLPEAFEVIKSWGFKYTTLGFVWLKIYPTKKEFVKGLGHYTRGNAELILIGIKGKPKIINHSISQIYESPRREHSRKPDELKEIISALVPPYYKKLEMFARTKHEDWDVWGNETNKFEEIKRTQQRLI